MLTTAQLMVLKADIAADPVLSAKPNTPDEAFAIADAYNQLATPDWWMWRTRVKQAEITDQSSVDSTDWSWTAFVGRTQGERDAWREMFATTGAISFARPNVRQGLQDIFSGMSGSAQRTHLLAVGRRKATRAEKLFGTPAPTGTTSSPATSAFEDGFLLTYQDVMAARSLP